MLTKKVALEVVGGLSRNSKMPCQTTGTPAEECNVGSKLAKKEGTTCNRCYAMKGRCAMPKSQTAQYRRLYAMEHEFWVDAMVRLIDGQDYFRWFDTGDIPGEWALLKIFEVCERTPNTRHWLPTREYKLVAKYQTRMPENLVIRVSSPMIDHGPIPAFKHTSTVHELQLPHGKACAAKKIDNVVQCGDCRACWDKRVKNISYKFH